MFYSLVPLSIADFSRKMKKIQGALTGFDRNVLIFDKFSQCLYLLKCDYMPSINVMPDLRSFITT